MGKRKERKEMIDDLVPGSIVKDGKYKVVERSGSWLFGYQLLLQEIESGETFKTRTLLRPNGLKSPISFGIGDRVQLLSGSIGIVKEFQDSGYLLVYHGKGKLDKINHRFLKPLCENEKED